MNSVGNLVGIDWNFNSFDGQTASVDEPWDHFKTSFVFAANKHAPFLHTRVQGVDMCLWLSKNIKINMRRCNFLLKRPRKMNNSKDWANYRCCTNKVSNSIRKANASYHYCLVKDCGEDHKLSGKQ